ncbi:hypothetical protein [Chamaesiphon sp. VAR_48_metabat_135_sub]|uniref:hypothetical protein n=1 Tax=Chamaesiphon sp. VAR_48_metabat_135_sub TaxID=2964699 RepID=UPI00286C49F1|nr:hypothetical protein [Chamaesiphon sp. VAR_48_metabat_135_sub]
MTQLIISLGIKDGTKSLEANRSIETEGALKHHLAIAIAVKARSSVAVNFSNWNKYINSPDTFSERG